MGTGSIPTDHFFVVGVDCVVTSHPRLDHPKPGEIASPSLAGLMEILVIEPMRIVQMSFHGVDSVEPVLRVD